MARTNMNVVSLAVAMLTLRVFSSLMVAGYIYYPAWSGMEIPLSSEPVSNSSNRSSSPAFPSITLGDLPGYTGWPRPSYTEAPFYEIESMTPPDQRKAHGPLKLIVRCSDCSTKNFAQFYVRMYGPSIITGHVTDLNRGRYEIKFLPRIAGKYWIEVVLTFSKGEDFGNYPVKTREPSYEGYLLPDFPLTVDIASNADDGIDDSMPFENRLCEAQDLEVEDNNDGMSVATWHIVKKINSALDGQRPSELKVKRGNSMTLAGYQVGRNSLGIFADYQPTNCNLIARNESYGTLFGACSSNRLYSKPIHLVFIGDSNLRIQKQHFSRKSRDSGDIKTTLISTFGGILETIENVKIELSLLDSVNEEVVIIFNSGLHDITVLCSGMTFRVEQRSGYVPVDFTCVDEYEKALTELAQTVSSFPGRVKIFQTTTAGWMRWGNFGFAWLPVQANQSFPQSTYFVDTFNQIAFRVLQGFDDIGIMDGYWMTLARPDNREVDNLNSVGRHLVHPGLEVLGALVRTWMTILLSKLGC